MEIKSGIYDVFETGTVITIHKNPIDFSIGGLLFRFQFLDEPEKEKNKLRAENFQGQKGIILTFSNFNESLGVGNKEPIPLGQVNNRKLYLNYRIYCLTQGTDKMIHYTWYLGEEVENGK